MLLVIIEFKGNKIGFKGNKYSIERKIKALCLIDDIKYILVKDLI